MLSKIILEENKPGDIWLEFTSVIFQVYLLLAFDFPFSFIYIGNLVSRLL
jgi:hypothetical protein